MTQASLLEVSRATHTAQVGQIQSLLSTLSRLSISHLITGTRPWPAASPVTRRMAQLQHPQQHPLLPTWSLWAPKAIPHTPPGHPDLLCSQVPLGQNPEVWIFSVILSKWSPRTRAPRTDRLISPDHELSAPATWSFCCHLPTHGNAGF